VSGFKDFEFRVQGIYIDHDLKLGLRFRVWGIGIRV
jgi:hypothetical protein